MKLVTAFALMMTLPGVIAAQAQQSPASPTAKAARRKSAKADSVLAEQLNQLKQAVDAQQQQIRQLSDQIQNRDQQIQQLQQTLQQSQATKTKADAADAQPAAVKTNSTSTGESQHRPANLGEVASLAPMVPAGQPTVSASVAQMDKAEVPPHQASDSIELAQGKIKLGALVYGDWAFYPKTGFGPQFLTQIFPPGPGNDDYNSFELTRTYLNFLFMPSKYLTIRVTPNLYREIGSPGTNGNLNLRMKYAYAELDNVFSGSAKEDNIRFGQQMNPLVDWEEGLYGYRFANLTPWNFISLSSTQAGVSINGPLKWNGKQYLDYQIGVFNNASFHAIENAGGKQFMARLSFYPMGAKSKYQGLGLTGFYDYGTSNVLPSTPDNKTFRQYRMAALVHYTTAKNTASFAFEYDRGKNAASSGNLFSTGTRPSGSFVDVNNLAIFLLDQPNVADTTQQGYDFFGHVNLGTPKWALFGMYELFQPNTAVANNPLDFSHVVGGLVYTVNKNMRFAFDSQNILWRHGTPAFSAAQASAYVPTSTGFTNVVGQDINAFFINMELSF